MSNIDTFKGAIHRGPGAVARWPGVSIVTPSTDDNTPFIDDFFKRLGPAPSIESIELIIEPLLKNLKAFAAIVNDSGLLTAMAYGPMMILVDSKPFLQGSTSLIKMTISDIPDRIVIRQDNEKASTPVSPYDLRLGIAPGAGLSLTRTEITVQPTKIQAENLSTVGNLLNNSMENSLAEINLESTTLSNNDHVDFESDSILISELSPNKLSPLPIVGQTEPKTDDENTVAGILCTRNHFNNPDATFCMICGVSLEHLSKEPVTGQRPTLGFIVFDDGATFGLDRSYIIGRNPDKTEDIEQLILHDNNETISRNHALVELDDWTVKITDQGSTNGTFVWDKTNDSWIQLKFGEEFEMESGITIALGRRAFVYESVGLPTSNNS